MTHPFRMLVGVLLPMLLVSPAPAAPSEPKTIPYAKSEDSIVVPTGSLVHYSGLKNRNGEGAAMFRGRFLLTGIFHYGDSDFNDSGDAHPSEYVFQPVAYIVPDDNIAARLPRFAIRNERPTIYLSNPAAFANAAIPKSKARRVRCRECGDVTGHIAIWVDQFTAEIECDHASYGVRFLSVGGQMTLTLAGRQDEAC